MATKVFITKSANKELSRLPKHVKLLFDTWAIVIEKDGLAAMQDCKGYRDHGLKGNRQGQRSSSLNRSWRIIYTLDQQTYDVLVTVLEVNNHDY